MKKIALAVLLASGLMAADNGMYVGFDLGKTKGEVKYNVAVPAVSYYESGKESDDGTSGTLKVGYYLNSNNRVYASVHVSNMDYTDTRNFGVGYDYLIGDNAFKPFVGLMMDYINNEIGEDGVTIDVDGMYYGGQLGVNYAINNNFSLEAGYRYMKSNADYSLSKDFGGIVVTENVELDYMSNWFVGVNYKF